MKHVLKIMMFLVAISAFWIGLLETLVVPRSYTWLLPIYLIVSLGCYGLLLVGIGLMLFPTCPQEAILLQKFLKPKKRFKSRFAVLVNTGPCHAPTIWYDGIGKGSGAETMNFGLSGLVRLSNMSGKKAFLKDIAEAKEFLENKGIDVFSN